MSRKFLLALPPVVTVVAFVAIPVVAQAIVPRVFVNGTKASTKHEDVFAFGPITLHNALLENLKCENFSAGQTWNEVVNGTERGFLQTTGYGTWECSSIQPVKVKNERGVEQEGIFFTAEGPPEAKTEKGHKSGATSLPWTGELTEKEVAKGGKVFVKIHDMKIWVVIPLCTEEGGTGKGGGCLLSGSEMPFEEREGETEKAAGDELEAKWVNGVKNGMSPSKLVYGSETEETGHLESGSGAGFMTGSLVTAGSTDFELLTAK